MCGCEKDILYPDLDIIRCIDIKNVFRYFTFRSEYYLMYLYNKMCLDILHPDLDTI